MTTQPQHSEELIPRPERTPAALRAALAVVAPERLPEMDTEQRRALGEAVEQNSLTPVHAFLLAWAAVIEIERFPATAQTLRHAEYMAGAAATPEESRRYVRIAGDVIRNAHRAVTE